MAGNLIQLLTDVGTLAQAPVGEGRQEYAEELVKRLLVYLPATISTFNVGGAMPTSDDGPWFKEVTDPKSGNSSYELWVWSASAATYVPLTLNQTQLRYYYGIAAPSAAVYDVWVKVDGNGKPLGVLTYNTLTAAWEPVSYTPDEIDAYFEGDTVGGKKQVDWDSLLNVPVSSSSIPRSVTGALGAYLNDPDAAVPVTGGANYNWEQVYHTDSGQMLVYDPSNVTWKTVDGGVGDLKFVTGNVIGTSSDFAAAAFGTILGRNPGWDENGASVGRTIVHANPLEAWDALSPAKFKDPGVNHGEDDYIMTKPQLPAAAIDVPIRASDAINSGLPWSNGVMVGDVATGSDQLLQTDNTGTGQPTSLVQKSIAYYVIRKIL